MPVIPLLNNNNLGDVCTFNVLCFYKINIDLSSELFFNFENKYIKNNTINKTIKYLKNNLQQPFIEVNNTLLVYNLKLFCQFHYWVKHINPICSIMLWAEIYRSSTV